MAKKATSLTVLAILIVIALLLYPRTDTRDAGDEIQTAAPETVAPDLSERRGAIVDQIVFAQESDAGRAAGLIEGGNIHVYAQGLTSSTIFRRLRDSEHSAYNLSYGSSGELSLNPAGPEFANGELNPFHNRVIREALNWLVDRRYIAEEIYGGLAVPRYLAINTAFPDYARLADEARALELHYRHDPERAREIITHEMQQLGAHFDGRRWIYAGQPVRIIVLIRTEDERQRVGDYIANLLEDLGFTAERRYRTADEASRIWIAGDPKAGGWHIYTGGWVSMVISRDLAGNFSYYYTPQGRPEPLWQAYDPDPELADIADRLQRRDYETWDERQALMTRALALSMEDSVRIWLVDQLNAWPRARDLELAVDLAAGIAGSMLWPYTIRFRDQVGGQVIFATPNLLTEPWNPVAGSGWIFDSMIINALQDSEFLPDPYTGLFWPQRVESAEVTVQENVPVIRSHDWISVEKQPDIEVPADTWIDWDSEAGRFIPVGEKYPDGISARTRTLVRYEDGYLDRRWHDGTRISLADVVLPWILTFDRADENSPLFDPSHVPTFEVFQRHFRGWRIVSREPLVIEIYSDQIFPDAEWIAATRTPGVTPWHTLALGILAERSGDLAFSSDKSDRLRVDWMSLVAGPSLPILDRHLQLATGRDFIPYANVLQEFMRDNEVQTRYQALADWYTERRHFWVSNGPFYLHSVHPVERNVVIRRNVDFPDPADKWLRFTRAEIPDLDLDGPMVVEAGTAAEFALQISFENEPYPVEAIDSVQFLLFDGNGELALQGEARHQATDEWIIDLSAEQLEALGSGANSLEVAVTSNRVALPAFASHTFATVPARSTGAMP